MWTWINERQDGVKRQQHDKQVKTPLGENSSEQLLSYANGHEPIRQGRKPRSACRFYREIESPKQRPRKTLFWPRPET
jgi:hypothetical protein